MYCRVILLGRLGETPDLRYTASGKAVTNLNIAVDSGFGDDKKTSWIRATAWERTAEIANEFLHKGSPIMAEGRLEERSWTTQDGQNRKSLEMIIDRLVLLPKNQDSAEGNGRPPARQQGRPGRPQRPPARQAAGHSDGYDPNEQDCF